MRRVRFTEAELREAIAASRSYSEALRRVGLRPAGGNHRTIKKYAALWAVSTEHFDQDGIRRPGLLRPRKPLGEVLVTHSTYSRRYLKRRLLQEGIKQPLCEVCGQGEIWLGRRMALILDHINGVPDDNRIENLRIVCPNCAATLDTHCGRKNRLAEREYTCARCGDRFTPKRFEQQYCSRACGQRWNRAGRPQPGARRAERPPYDVLMAEIAASSYLAVGRHYGVSDNAIRKWVRAYQRDEAADSPEVVPSRSGEVDLSGGPAAR